MLIRRHPALLTALAILALFTLAVTLMSEAYGSGALATSTVKLLGKTLCLALAALGAAGALAVASALIRQTYPAAQLGRGLGINSVIVASSAAAAPTACTSGKLAPRSAGPTICENAVSWPCPWGLTPTTTSALPVGCIRMDAVSQPPAP